MQTVLEHHRSFVRACTLCVPFVCACTLYVRTLCNIDNKSWVLVGVDVDHVSNGAISQSRTKHWDVVLYIERERWGREGGREREREREIVPICTHWQAHYLRTSRQ